MTSSVTGRNIVDVNQERARDLVQNLDGRKFPEVAQNATAICDDGRIMMRAGVRNDPADVNNPFVVNELTSVLYDLNNACTGANPIQHNLPVLIPLIKAHRVVTEIAMHQYLNNEKKLDTTDRESLLSNATRLKDWLSSVDSAAGARYEVSCLKQAAKCISPTDSVWKQLFSPAADAVDAIAGRNPGSLIKSLVAIGILVQKEHCSAWYHDVHPLEWHATNVISMQDFEREIEPHVADFISKGGKYTLGLVKVLTTILKNPESTPQVKEKAFNYLVQLLNKKPEYSITVLEKILKRLDPYIETRKYAAVALKEVGSQQEYKDRVKAIITGCNTKVQDPTSKGYLQQKGQTVIKAEMCHLEKKELEGKKNSFQERLNLAVAHEKNTTRTDNAYIYTVAGLKQERLTDNIRQKELDKELEACEQELKLANAYQQIDEKEAQLFTQLLTELG